MESKKALGDFLPKFRGRLSDKWKENKEQKAEAVIDIQCPAMALSNISWQDGNDDRASPILQGEVKAVCGQINAVSPRVISL